MYKQVIDSCFRSSIGESGISDDALSNQLEELKPIINELKSAKDDGSLRLLSVNYTDDGLDEITEVAKDIKSNFDDLVILGTGGSSLCGQTLVGLNEIERKYKKTKPQIHFLDNVDPETVSTVLTSLDLTKTCFLAISKSGGTLETLSQFLVCLSAVKEKLGDDVGKNFYVISDPAENPLRNTASKFNIRILDHDPDIGGRFSILTNVGLLPAAVSGLNIKEIRKGAKAAIDKALVDDLKESPAAIGAAINLLLEEKINTTVFMPYIDRLGNLANWLRQIWAESLGKDGRGTNPIKAAGTVDQHSQLQLYLGGPNDKLFNIFTMKQNKQGDKIDSDITGEEKLAYMNGKSIGDVITVFGEATKEALVRNQRPVRRFELSKLDEEVIGELATQFILETIIVGKAQGINPFDQPAVEEGKVIAKKLLESV